MKKLKTLKCHTFYKKHKSFLLFAARLAVKLNRYSIPKNMAGEKISQEFRSKEIDKTTNYFIEDIKQNELISKKHKKVCKILKYTEHLLILASTVTRCVSISAPASLVNIPVAIENRNFRNNCRD